MSVCHNFSTEPASVDQTNKNIKCLNDRKVTGPGF